MADLAWLLWGTGGWSPRQPSNENIGAAVNAYRRHIEVTDEELDRLEAVMYIRPLYLVCFAYRRFLATGVGAFQFGFIEPPEYFAATAAATRKAFGR
jgi:Ser/Thr protein kinase RdoA (MazF antagonist)